MTGTILSSEREPVSFATITARLSGDHVSAANASGSFRRSNSRGWPSGNGARLRLAVFADGSLRYSKMY